MKTLFLHFLSLPAVARLNRRLAGLVLLWLLALLLFQPPFSAPPSSPTPDFASIFR
jgi:hypothetical protein